MGDRKAQADLRMAQLMPLPLSLAPVNPDWFNFYLPAFYLSGTGSPGVCVCVL